MKALTERQARNCEEAKGPVCRCRCGGALHGAKRGGDNPDRTWYEALPEDDPHLVKKKKADEPAEELPKQLPLFQELKP